MRHALAALLVLLAALCAPRTVAAQLGAMVSPGRLTHAHASLEGVANCQKCHEAGKQVSANKCLSCHKPIADRIRIKKGVHRDVTGDCVTCHVEHMGEDAELRPFEASKFDHLRETGFALDGRHAARACAACHKTRSFLAVRSACASCHNDVHQGQLGPDCARCHATSIGFKETRRLFDHSRTSFPLSGAHLKMDCTRCHPNGRFKGAVALRAGRAGGAVAAGSGNVGACASCHQTPHKTPVGSNCATCHSSSTWSTNKIDHAKTGFALRGLHGKVDCATCHRQPATQAVLKFQKCADCHADPHAGRFRQDCASCHNERGFGGAPFDHAAQTRFPLTGAHTRLQCVSCHKPALVIPGSSAPQSPARTGKPLPASSSARGGDFRGLRADCGSCHRDVHAGEAGGTCESCHSSATFHDVTYVHKTSPEFFGSNHAKLPCAKCHTLRGADPKRPVADGFLPPRDRWPWLMLASSRGFQRVPRPATTAPTPPPATQTGTAPGPDNVRWRFKSTPTDCASCHKDPHLGQLGNACERCHTVASVKFAPTTFAHANAGFPLTGKHVSVPCAGCHKTETGTFPAGVGTAVRYKSAGDAGARCASCHKDAHLGQLGKKCELCHKADGFPISNYTHLLRPEMGRGRHAAVECRACHKREEGTFPDGMGAAIRFIGFGEGCASCHSDVHRGSMGGSCETCHSVESFHSISRAFHKGGAFALEGRHLDVPCASCHVNGQIKGTPTKCFDCHWQRRRDDRYQLRLGADCDTCHRPVSWTATRWSHSAATGVPLNPTHRILGCDSCHKQLEFRKGIAVDCASCHQRDFQQTSQPNHASAGFPMACEACHKPSDPDWHRARFDHAAAFPLLGQHALAQCAQCHKGSTYKGTPRECIACHQADFNGAQQPNHVASGFSPDCETCHRATDPDWHRANFNHDQYFQLVGQHRLLQCVACHKENVYRGTSRDCVGCHRTDYERTQTPNHAASGFSTDCQSCHRPTDPDWHSANFNHDSTFRLEGVHRTVTCASCHKNGVYRGTPRDCVSCHQADYNRTANPSHTAAGFSTDCASCHRASDSSWNQGRFNHPFPLSGPHNVACRQCHLDPATYKVFSCTVCHGRTETDSHHSGVNGYRYDSAACYACHPNGRH